PRWAAWVLAVIAAGAVVVAHVGAARRRARAGLAPVPTAALAPRIAAVAIAFPAIVALMNADRGLLVALLILLGFVVSFDVLLRRTRFGRYVFAVGGNAEAARRAGIPVDRIRVVVFTLSGALAACGGILAASRLLAVNQSSGAGDVLLNAIA